MHPLLARQLRAHAIDPARPPEAEAWASLLDSVDRAYTDADESRYALERTLAVSSHEMEQLCTDLRSASASELARERDRMLALFASLGDGLCVLGPDERVVEVNPEACRLLGCTESDAVDRSWRELLTVQGTTDWSLDGRDPRPLRDVDAVAHRADGGVLPVHVSVNPIVHRGATIGAVLVFRDVSGRMQLEQQLRQAQKMDAVGRLAGGIAHDFNNLLTAMLGYGNMVLDALEPDNPLRPDVFEIVAAGERAAGLTRQLLAFSRKQLLRPAVLDVNDVVSGVESMLRRLIGENIHLETHLSPAPPVEADPTQLEQVLLNLAVNSRDAMPDGGRLTIETAVADLDERYARAHGAAIAPGRYTMVAVSDTGHGMDAETQARIFEPFFTTKAPGEGTGLGLSTVYGIVKQSGGYVWLYSEAGRGSTFKVYLPVVERPIERHEAAPQASSLPRGSETVLVVEDEPAVRELTCEVLRRQGYTVLEAADGSEGLAVALPRLTEIALVISDVVMPGMSGPQFVEALARQAPDIRVLFTSGYTDGAIVNHGHLKPGLHFLQKPFSPSVLVRMIRRVIDGVEDGAPQPRAAARP